MERLFWVECPACACRWYADWELRHSEFEMICPQCGHEFPADEASWIDERQRS